MFINSDLKDDFIRTWIITNKSGSYSKIVQLIEKNFNGKILNQVNEADLLNDLINLAMVQVGNVEDY